MNIFNFREPRFPKNDRGRACEAAPPFVKLPGINCYPDGCGEIWASTGNRIYKELSKEHPLYRQKSSPVSPAEFERIVNTIKIELNLPTQEKLLPGTLIGHLRVKCKRSSEIPSFEWPAINTLLITEETRNFLVKNGLTGWHTEDVTILNSSKGQPLPPLYEMVIDGRAGTPLISPSVEVVSVCNVCGRVKYNQFIPDDFQIDVAQWDGSDFMRFSPPFNGYIFIGERSKEILENSSLNNFWILSTADFLLMLKSYKL